MLADLRKMVANRQHWEGEKLFERMREEGVADSQCYTVFLNLLSQQGKMREMEVVLIQMKDMGIQPTLSNYNTLLGAMEKHRRFKDACSLYKRLPDGLVPDYFTHNTYLSCVAQHHGVRRLFLEIEELKAKGFVPNSVTHVIVMRALERTKRNWALINYFHRVGDYTNPDIVHAGLQGLGRSGDTLGMMRLMKRCVAKGFEPSSQTLNIMLNLYGLNKDISDMMKMFRTMLDGGFVTIYTFGVVVNHLGNAGDLDEIERTLAVMEELGIEPNTVFLTLLADAYGKNNQIFAMVGLVRVIIENLPFDGAPVSMCVTRLMERGLVLEALRLLKDVRTPYLEYYRALIPRLDPSWFTERGLQIKEHMTKRLAKLSKMRGVMDLDAAANFKELLDILINKARS